MNVITALDQIVVPAAQAEALEALFHQRYIEGAAARGLLLQSMQWSPPVITRDNPLTLWLRWEVAGPEAWWAMRAQSGCAGVHAFWAAVDALCLSRQRTYLGDVSAGELPRSRFETQPTERIWGYRETAQLLLKNADEDAESLEATLNGAAGELPGLMAAQLSRNLAPEYAAGHYTWDLLFSSESEAAQALASDAWRTRIAPALETHCQAVHAFALEHIQGGIRAPHIAGGIKRTAFFRLLPAVDAGTAQRFEADLLEMPGQLGDIQNWRLSRAKPAPWNHSGVAPWTYIWEQEFTDLEGLTGPYMSHPHHWAHVDRWFDPESGSQIIDVDISHAFGLFDKGLLPRELR